VPFVTPKRATAMSALGQKQTSRHLQPMSALPPKVDIRNHPVFVEVAPAIAQTPSHAFRTSPGSLAILLTILRASSLLSRLRGHGRGRFWSIKIARASGNRPGDQATISAPRACVFGSQPFAGLKP